MVYLVPLNGEEGPHPGSGGLGGGRGGEELQKDDFSGSNGGGSRGRHPVFPVGPGGGPDDKGTY